MDSEIQLCGGKKIILEVEREILGQILHIADTDSEVRQTDPSSHLQRFVNMPATSTHVYIRGEGDFGKKESVLCSPRFNITFTLGKLRPTTIG